MEKKKKDLAEEMKLKCSKCGEFIAAKSTLNENGKLTHKGCGGKVRVLTPGK